MSNGRLIVKKLNKAIPLGERIPKKYRNGNQGHYFENRLEENGYTINRSKGCDLKELGVEVKSRLETSNSAHTVGAMTLEDILSTDYYDSNVHDKIQLQYRIYFNEDYFVTRQELFDFSNPDIQSLLEASYEQGKLKLAQYPDWDYVRGKDCIAYFELNNSGLYAFRVSEAGMRKIEKMSKSKFNDFFEVTE